MVVMGVDVRSKQMELMWQFSVGQSEEQLAFEKLGANCPTTRFWRSNQRAYAENRHLNLRTTRAAAEKQIVDNVNRVRQTWSKFWMICDNPAMDIRILDNILLSHGADPISIRPPNHTYMQVICSWSYQLSASALLFIPRHTIRTESSRAASEFMSRCHPAPCLPHTPVYDCVLILCTYIFLAHTITLRRDTLLQLHKGETEPSSFTLSGLVASAHPGAHG
jgi:hypothetical protein